MKNDHHVQAFEIAHMTRITFRRSNNLQFSKNEPHSLQLPLKEATRPHSLHYTV